jgi:hypothetical protein
MESSFVFSDGEDEMTNQKITQLENLDDLDLLMKGDVVQMVYNNIWGCHEKNNEYLAAYHAICDGMFQFLVPTPMSKDSITTYKARKDLIQVKDGRIFLKEDKCVIEPIGPGDCSYNKLNDTLKAARLR